MRLDSFVVDINPDLDSDLEKVGMGPDDKESGMGPHERLAVKIISRFQ